MKVTLLLADHAQVADGKLFISGASWDFASIGRLACGVGVIFHVPWDDSGRRIKFTIRLVDAGGEPVMRGESGADTPIEVSGEFEVGRPAHGEPGDDLHMPVAFNAQLQLKPGLYTWQVEIDGQVTDDWRWSFRVCGTTPSSTDI
ncbi:DUF6941 family protein [Streptosporangium sp. NPDC050855]|uniref:DUF6941 family protein n=1 Tax=Streptosporangium sp. NPDC050855 TaxID=3366194 RepID=UPI003789B1D1